MKLLQLVEAATAGVGRHVMDLTEGLLDRGCEVHLLYSDLRADEVFTSDLRRLSVRSGFHAFRLRMQREPSGSDLQAIWALRGYLRSYGSFDLVHCHSTKAGLIGRLGQPGHSLKRLYSPHLFLTMDPTRSIWFRRPVARLESALSKLCQGVVAVSRQEYEHARHLGIAPCKLHLIPHGVVLDRPGLSPGGRAALRQRWGLLDTSVCIGFVGRLVPFKSPETMLKAFAAVVGRVDRPVRLVVIGDGPLAGPLRRLAAVLGIEAYVVWVGEQDAKPLMDVFDIFALTSDAEAGPLVVLEAMARGLPIVATPVGLISESVHPGTNGFIAPVRGVQQIAEALTVLVRDPALRERMGRASRAIAQDFSVDRMVDKTLLLYQRIVSGARAPAGSPEWTVARLP